MTTDIANKIKEKINTGELKMKPKGYFVLGSILATIGIILFGVMGTFVTSVLIHRIKMQRFFSELGNVPFGRKTPYILVNFPWELLILSIVFLIIGLYLIKKFDVSYKKSFILLIIVFVSVVLVTAIGIDKIGIHDRFKKIPRMQRLYMQRDNPNLHNKDFERKMPRRLYKY